MKKTTKIISVILCAVMVLSCFGVAASAESSINYLVLGDSIGWGAGIQNHNEACYGRIIANTNNFNYNNDAVNGNMTDDLLSKLKNNSSVISHVKNADIISISIGGNDFLRDNMPALISNGLSGDYSGMEKIISELKANFLEIISLIKGYNPDAVILMQTLYNPIEGSDVGDKVYAVGIGMLNDVYKNYYAENPGEIEIVDVASAFSGKKGLISWDNIHPNAEGNYVIARTVQAKLYDLSLADTTEIVIKTAGRDWVPTTQSFWDKIVEFFNKIINFFRNLFS